MTESTAAVTLPAPKVEFFLLNPDSPPPEPASPSVRGILPTRGVQMCTPLTAASGLGWYLFPPVDFALRWDGQTTDFALLVENEPAEWRSLSGAYELSLDGDNEALARAPERFKADLDIFDYHKGRLPFIDVDPRLGNTCEIISGMLARTPEGWSLLVRDVPNWPKARDHQILEGIVDTWWFGSFVPIMIRLLETGRVVRFHRTIPWAVVQLVPRVALEGSHEASPDPVRGIENLPDDIWDRFVQHRRRRLSGKGRGTYRAEQRQHDRALTAERAEE